MAVGLKVIMWYRPHFFCFVNQVVLMLARLNLNEKAGGLVYKKVTSSLPFISHGTEHSTVKRLILVPALDFRSSGSD